MPYHLEVAERFSARQPADRVLYSGDDLEGEVETTRVYRLDTDASRDDVESFARDVLVDPVSQDWELRANGDGDASFRTGFCLRLDVELKPGVLNLERQYLLDFLEEFPNSRLRLDGLGILERHYFFASGGEETLKRTARRDLVNPVIHRWRFYPDGHDG